MTINIDLTKKAEAVTFVLEKRGVTKAPIMRVCAALDISGSMDDEIRDGSLQRAVDQLGGIGIKFDDNGEIDIWKFDNRSDYVGTWTPDDYGNYINKNRITSRGGTAYSPFINDIKSKMFAGESNKVARQVEVKSKGFLGFGKKKTVETVYDTVMTAPNQEPVLVLVITDGEPLADNYNAISTALRGTASLPMFFVFVGVSNQSESFPTLKQINKDHSNCSFIKLNGFKLTDEQVYDAIICDKLVKFIKQF